jgi:hypothetical protein
MVQKWLFSIGLAVVLVGAISPIAQAGVSLRLNVGAPVKRFNTFHPAVSQPRFFASGPSSVAPPGVVQRPLRIPGRWQWTPWGWYWASGYVVR